MLKNNPKIILLEDDEIIKIAIKEYLTYNGFDIIIPESLRDIEDYFTNCNADCVITDILMPDTDGIEVIIAVRKFCPDIVIIAISGGGRVSSAEYLNIAYTLGANAVLQKPFLLSDLLNLIKKLLAEKGI